MDAGERRVRRKSVWDLLFGLQLGVIGSVLMLTWFAIISPVLGYPWWLILNASASHFYNTREVNLGPGVVTLVGIAVQIAASGIIGCVNGVLTPGGRLWGIAMAAVWYLLCYFFLWKRIAPLLLSQSVQPVLWAGYFILGSVLGWHEHIAQSRKLKEQREALVG